RGATAVLEAERGAILGRPFGALVAVDDVRHAVFQLARSHRREQVGGHPGQVEMAVGRNAVVLHASLPYCPNCARLPGSPARAPVRDFDRQREAAMHKMTGRVAIVTGASRGIGQAIAELFAQEGAKVVCVARTLNEGDHQLKGSLATTVADIKAAGGEATAVAADISSEAECLRLVEAARAAYGGIDTPGNNAALHYYLATADSPAPRWTKAFAINVHAPFILAKAVLPDMIAAGRGAI